MNVTISPDLEPFVNEKIASGAYQDANAVVRAGLDLLREREKKRDELRHEIQIGLDQADRGETAAFTDELAGGVKARGRRGRAATV